MRKAQRDFIRDYLLDRGYDVPPETRFDVVRAWAWTIIKTLTKWGLWGCAWLLLLGMLYGGDYVYAMLLGLVMYVVHAAMQPEPAPPALPAPYGDAAPATARDLRGLGVFR